MAQKIHPINGTLEGAELIQAINDRFRRVAAATDNGGTTGARGAPGAPGPAGTVGAVNLLRYRTILGVPSLRTLDRELYDILAESTSVENYGVVGDGLADDHVAFQDALLTQAVNGGWLRIPGGFNLNIYGATIEMPSNVRLIGDGAALSKITGNGTAVQGMLHFSAVSDVTIVGIGFEGGVTTPVGIPYVTRGDPSDLQWTIGTTLRIESGSKRISIEDCDWNHTGGYAVYWYGNVDTLIILRPSIRNSRPAVMGVGSDLNYFGWNGGIFGASDGVSNFFQNVHVIDAFFANCTGHCFWTRAAALPPLPVINRNVSFTGSAEDCLGDITQPGGIDVYEEDFTARRVGMICTNGSLTGFTTAGVLIDSSPTAYRAPKWMNLYDPTVPGPAGVPNRNVPPTASDTTGILLNSFRRMVLDGVNGGAGSGDGMANATIICIATSAFYSTDPLIDIAHCGPAGNNINYCSGYVTSNSNRLAAVGENINFLGCVMNGFGFISIGIYGGRRGSISDCVAHVPVVDGQGSPFVLGCVGTPGVIGGFADRAYSNKVTGCHIEWPAPGGSAIAEDAQYGSFAPGDTNWIDSNNTYTCGALYFKNPTTSTTTNKLILTSVTAAAQSIVGSFLQSEGVLTSHADHALKAYRLDGVELWKSAAATFTVPSLSTEPSGWIAHRTYVLGNSVLDPNGHIQTATSTTGVSAPGPGLPPFSSTGGSVTDGTVTWKDMGLFTSSLVLDANYIGGPNAFFNSVSITGTMVLNSSRELVNLTSVEAVGNFNSTTGGYKVGGVGVITNDRDFYGRSLSIDTDPAIAASAAGLVIADDRTAYLSQVYIGAHGGTPILVINSLGEWVGPGGLGNDIGLGTYDWSFTSGTGVTGSLGTPGLNTLTFTTAPPGGDCIYIHGGTGTPEMVTASWSGGVATFHTVFPHSGAWIASSQTRGAQEQLNAGAVAFPIVIMGSDPSTAWPAFEQTDASFLVGRNTNTNNDQTSLNRNTIGVQTVYSGQHGTAAGVHSLIRVTGNLSGNGTSAFYGVIYSDAATFGEMIALHGEANCVGPNTAVSVNAEGRAVAGVLIGLLSNTGIGPSTEYSCPTASWSALGVATYYTTVAHDILVGGYVFVKGVSNTAWNFERLQVTAVTAFSVSVAMPTNPGSYGGSPVIAQSPAYYGCNLKMHHQYVNSGGGGLFFEAATGRHPYAIRATDVDDGRFDTGILLETKSIGIYEFMRFSVVDVGFAAVPSLLTWYHGGVHLADFEVKALYPGPSFQHSRITMRVNASGVLTETVFVDLNGLRVVSGALIVNGSAGNPAVTAVQGYMQSAEGFYCPSAEDGLHVFDGTKNGYVYMHGSDHNLYIVSDQYLHLETSSGGFIVVGRGLSETLQPAANITASLGSTSIRWLKLWAQDLNLSGGAAITGGVSAGSFQSGTGLTASSITPGGANFEALTVGASVSTMTVGPAGISTSGPMNAISYKVGGSLVVITGSGVFAGNGISMNAGINIGTNGIICHHVQVPSGVGITGSLPVLVPGGGTMTIFYDGGVVWRVA